MQLYISQLFYFFNELREEVSLLTQNEEEKAELETCYSKK